MEKQFEEGELNTIEDDEINSLIMSEADDISEKLTELECKLNGVKCYNSEMEGETEVLTYTPEALEIFTHYYDEHVTKLYKLLNSQLKIIK